MGKNRRAGKKRFQSGTNDSRGVMEQGKNGTNSKHAGSFHIDGYSNMLNKYGTKEDVSEQYRFESDVPVTDVELTLNYEENGLFAKIIDIPAEDAVSSGFSYGINDMEMEDFINNSLDELDFEEKIATAIKWSRLYGGSLVVMMIDDGKRLEEPVDWDGIQGIDELLVFERPVVTPDYNSVYQYKPDRKRSSQFGMPEFYEISPAYGPFVCMKAGACFLRMEYCHLQVLRRSIVFLASRNMYVYIEICRKRLLLMEME